MNEAQLLREVLDLAKKYGVLAFHSYGPPVSTAGFPDLVLAGQHGVVFAELKSDSGQTSAEQDLWAWNLQQSGQKYVVFRPMHLETGAIDTMVRSIR